MQEYSTIQRQLDALTGTISAQRHEEQRKFAEAMTSVMEPRSQANRIIVDEHHPGTENRAQRRERERKERRAAKKVPA